LAKVIAAIRFCIFSHSNSLDAQAAAKVATAKLRMELGNTSNVKRFSGIEEYVVD
jgi:hypothetical protein